MEIFQKNLLNGSVLLLGNTKDLLTIADRAIDLNPLYLNAKIIQGDWRNNRDYYKNIIGDGVLNFNEKLTLELFSMIEKNSSRFIARVFNRKLEIMRIAEYFPSYLNFTIRPLILFESKDYNIYQWDFYKKMNHK